MAKEICPECDSRGWVPNPDMEHQRPQQPGQHQVRELQRRRLDRDRRLEFSRQPQPLLSPLGGSKVLTIHHVQNTWFSSIE